jgi:predicted nucleotidyltransferase
MLNRLKKVFASFDSHDVHYVIIGGVAAILHGVPRSTLDVDILIEATPENAKKLLEAMAEAGLGTASLTSPEGVLANVITVFDDRVRIDVQTSTPGVAFPDAWKRRKRMDYGGQTFFVLSREDLIASKLAAGRQVDLEDVRILRLEREGKGA